MTDSQVLMIVGSQWGDEGKGKLVDYLSDKVDVCARCQGGDNAGHTIVANGIKFDFHILPSGVIHEQCTNIIGNGCVVYIPGFFSELEKTKSKGVNVDNRIFISDRAHVVFDIHQVADGLNEKSLGGSNIGTTKRGIGPTYTSKAARSGVRLGDLRFDTWKQKLRNIAENYKLKFGDSFTVDIDAEIARYEELAKKILPYVTDTVHYINKAFTDGKKILIEGANAIMLDLDYGTYPYVTSSSTGCGGATTGLGLSPNKIQTRYGVVKAYTTRVGSGPFPTEQLNEAGERMQSVGFEVGTTTGRKRRCGWLDLILLRYSHLLNDYTALCLTKLDVLTGFEELLVAVGYVLDGKELPSFPANLEDLARVEVTYKSFPGWKEDITNVRSFADLPVNAQNYVTFIEEFIGSPVSWIGVGPARDAMIDRTK